MSAANNPKVPAAPPAPLILEPGHVRVFEAPLWRVFSTTGHHPQVWNGLRHFGPVPGMRFDPHTSPMAHDPQAGVMYAATLAYTAIGEVYQDERVIDRAANNPAIASWTPSRPLQLVDLTSNWPVINGAAAAMMDDKKHTQPWARAIDQQLGADIDGLYHLSSINGQPMITLFSRTERIPAFPPRVGFLAQLSDIAADEIIKQAQSNLGYLSI